MSSFHIIIFTLLGVSTLFAILKCIFAKDKLEQVLCLDYIGFVCLGLLILLGGTLKDEAYYDISILLAGIGFFLLHGSVPNTYLRKKESK